MVDVGEGEGDAVDADGALGRHELHKGGREPDRDAPLGGGLDPADGAEAVDVSLDEVSTEAVADLEGAFEIHPVA